MRLFDEIARKANEIAQIGDKVRAEAQATGTPVCYTEPAYGTDVIVEYPDGHRERLMACGSAVTIAPRGLGPLGGAKFLRFETRPRGRA